MGNVHMEAKQINDRTETGKRQSVADHLKALDALAQKIDNIPTFTSNDRAFLEELPAFPSEDGAKVLTATTTSGETSLSYEAIPNELPASPATDGTKVLTATTTSGETVLSWEEPASGFNLPILCAYGSSAGIGGVSAKCNYWFGLYASSGHQIPSISAGSNCTVSKIVDHSESVEDSFALYKIEKTNASAGATISETYIDTKALFGISEFYNLGEFTKSVGNVGTMQVTTNKPILVCMQSGLSNALYPIVGTATKGKDTMITRCQYGSYDNGEVHVIFPEDGEIDITFTHNTIFAYAEISESAV